MPIGDSLISVPVASLNSLEVVATVEDRKNVDINCNRSMHCADDDETAKNVEISSNEEQLSCAATDKNGIFTNSGQVGSETQPSNHRNLKINACHNGRKLERIEDNLEASGKQVSVAEKALEIVDIDRNINPVPSTSREMTSRLQDPTATASPRESNDAAVVKPPRPDDEIQQLQGEEKVHDAPSKHQESQHHPSTSYELLMQKRKSLPLLPRMSQYERHPLLQTKSSSGVSEFELLLIEREQYLRRNSVEDQQSSQLHKLQQSKSEAYEPCGGGGDRKLIPRSAHYEPHPLLKKSASGACELELFLIEKESEKLATTGNNKVLRRQTSLKLEPRTSQWERHALLEVKDESGLSEIDKLFLDREEEQVKRRERGKCRGSECGCKNSQCTKCKAEKLAAINSSKEALRGGGDGGARSSSAAGTDTDETGEASTAGARLKSETEASFAVCGGVSRAANTSQKRVRFQRQKSELEDLSALSTSARNTNQNKDPNSDMTSSPQQLGNCDGRKQGKGCCCS